MKKLTLTFLENKFIISKLDKDAPIPNWAQDLKSDFLSITRTADELSIVCEKRLTPKELNSVGDWYAFKVEGPLDFSLIGILSALLDRLAKAGISVFSVSTYDTDYILLKEKNLLNAIEVLKLNYYVNLPKAFKNLVGNI